jgi:hypothetical protein
MVTVEADALDDVVDNDDIIIIIIIMYVCFVGRITQWSYRLLIRSQ